MRDTKDQIISLYEDTLRMIARDYSSYPQLLIVIEGVLEVGEKLQNKK